MTSDTEEDRRHLDWDLSYEEFSGDCEDLVEISDSLGDGWTLVRQSDSVWLELSQSITVSSRAALCQFQVHYSLSYRVPILLSRYCWSSGELMDHDTARREVLGEMVSYEMVSMAPHPLTGLPWFQVHPCKTESVTREMRQTEGREKCNSLVTFLSLYGQAVGLRLSPEYARIKDPGER